MNEQDKKAFEKWFLEYPSWIVTMSRQESCSKAWQAACEFKQKEIDELEKEKDYLCKKMENMRSIYKDYEELQAENTELTKLATEFEKKLKNIRKDAVIYCIKKLRDLQNKYRHQSIWNHSNDPKFAPVELSDYLFINVLRKMDDL